MSPKPEPNSADASLARRIRMLRTAMGPEIAAALEDPEVVEVLLNPDGSLWIDRLGAGRAPTGHHLPAPVAERIIRLVAAHVRAEMHAGLPILSAELPETGERFLGVLPPVVRAPSFAIRKRALRILTLAQYVADGILTEAQAEFLRHAVRERYITLKNDLTHDDFDAFFNHKSEWHPELDNISQATRSKLRQVLFRILREADLVTANNMINAAMLSPRLLDTILQGNRRDLLYFPAVESDLKGIPQ